MTTSTQTATLAGGCFWCLEAIFDALSGVISVRSGFSGGHTEQPSYKQVCGGDTGHAEVVHIEFDPSVIGFADLLEVFFAMHDPTTPNRQGNDVGTQYRSAVYYHSPEQKAATERMIARIGEEQWWPGKVVTEVVPFERFWPAEDYHTDYFAHNPDQPYCAAVVGPKVAKFRQKFADLLKR